MHGTLPFAQRISDLLRQLLRNLPESCGFRSHWVLAHDVRITRPDVGSEPAVTRGRTAEGSGTGSSISGDHVGSRRGNPRRGDVAVGCRRKRRLSRGKRLGVQRARPVESLQRRGARRETRLCRHRPDRAHGLRGGTAQPGFLDPADTAGPPGDLEPLASYRPRTAVRSSFR